jgi:small-conductance mechanosensitive channel
MQEVIEIGQEAIEIGRDEAVPWILGLAVAAGVYLVLAFARRLLLRRVERSDAQVGWLNGLRQALTRTSSLFLLVLAIYAGTSFVALPPAVDRAINSALVIALFLQGALWASHIVVGWVAWYAASKAEQNRAIANALQLIQLFARVVVWSIAFLLILNNLGFDVTALVAGLGIGGIAIALAVQNVLSDLFASLSIVLDKPFVLGDFIIVGDMLGTVEYVGLKTTRVRSLSGEQLVFANSDLLNSRIRNFKRMYHRRVVFSFGVTYQTPYEKAARIGGIVREIVEAQKLTRFDRAHFQQFGDFALVYEVVYHVLDPDFNVHMDIQEAINLELMRRFQAEGIEFAYPTQTLFLEKAGA